MTRMSSNNFRGCTQPEVIKRFYYQFKAEYNFFSQHVQGIPLLIDKLNYTSLLLQRLLFLYFLQKQHLLNNDLHYLSNCLQLTQHHSGRNHFYRQYLLPLFSQLYSPHIQFNSRVGYMGKLPTLPISLFEIQEIERINEHLDVPDQAFIRIFAFFDLYTWRSDVGATQSENELRPDILAYILEHSIDQKQAGAYYTQEDITTYIASNTIVASLFARVIALSSSEERTYMWRLLQVNPDRYIHLAIQCTGYLVEETEIEYQQRHIHYQQLSTQLRSGRVQSVDDLITYNLDLVSFAVDAIRNSRSTTFLLTIYKQLTTMLVLDPTCGTGAFLLAALLLLHTLYTACIERLQDIAATKVRLPEIDEISAENLQHIDTILEQIGLYSTPTHFILSTIITRNLYGVDLMQRAVEICQLRLLLTVLAYSRGQQAQDSVSVLHSHIRIGNTLVGDIRPPKASCPSSHNHKRIMPTISVSDGEGIRDECRVDRPFHWQEEFPMLAEQEGFDVILGNPPYLEYCKVKQSYTIYDNGEKGCGNVYAAVIERSLALCRTEKSYLGLMVPISLCSGERFTTLRQKLLQTASTLWLANFEIFPCRLFTNAFQRVSIILIAGQKPKERATLQVTKTHRWFAQERPHLLQCLRYTKVEASIQSRAFPKLASFHQGHIIHKMLHKARETKIATFLHPTKTRYFVYYQEATNYWTKAVCCIPYYSKNGEIMTPSHGRFLFFKQEQTARIIMVLMNSSLFYLWFTTYADGFHLSHAVVKAFPLDDELLRSQKLYNLALLLEKDIQNHARLSTHNTKDDRRTRQPGHRIELEEYYLRYSKNILDEVDSILAQYYSFTQEELDFILNYDIKYRLSKRGKK